MFSRIQDGPIQEAGPLAVYEGSARLKKTPSLSFYLKIVGTTI